MTLRWFVALVGGALLIVGVFLGLSGVNAGSISCGSAFSPDGVGVWGLPGEPEKRAAACDQAIGSRPAFAWVLLGGGAILLLGGIVVQPQGRRDG